MTSYKPKLIEVALPLAAINAEASREKSIRHGHPSTLHLWWARRPLAAARAVIWASLVDDPSSDDSLSKQEQEAERQRLFGILERLVKWENSNNEHVLAEAKAEIDRCFATGPPPILDPFAGGGSIPLEAQRLGLSTAAGDLNPVAVLIQRAMMEIPHGFTGRGPVNPSVTSHLASWPRAQGLATDIDAYSRWMQEEAWRRVGSHFPSATGSSGELLTPIAWIWIRTIRSPNPTWSGHVPLTTNWILQKSEGNPTVWVEPQVDESTQSVSYRISEVGVPPEPTIKRVKGTCIATGAAITNGYIRAEGAAGRLGNQMVAIVAKGPKGRVYCEPTEADRLAASVTYEDAYCMWRPEGLMPTDPKNIHPPRYGFKEWWQLFMPRQLLTLATFLELLEEVRPQVEMHAREAGFSDDGVRLRDGGSGVQAYADAVITYLAFNINRCAVRWNHLSRWHSVGEKLEGIFRLNAFPMMWMHADGNPFSDSTGNWQGQIDWITKYLKNLPSKENRVDIKQQDARTRVKESAPCVVCTDPPYYDNVGYSDLSDFFYVWLRRSVGDIWPDECATILTPKTDELVADNHRYGSREAAESFFESRMGEVMRDIALAQTKDAPATIFYAYKATEIRDGEVVSTGWDTFLQAIVDAGMMITATWPMRTEMQSRRANDNMLSSSVVLACRPRVGDASPLPPPPPSTRAEFVAELKKELPEALRVLQTGNIAPVDLAQAAIGPGIRIFSSKPRVVEADGSAMPVRKALVLINDLVSEILDGAETELDADSRFAVGWYSQHGFASAAFGDADNLARAKNTSVQATVEAGIGQLEGGKYRLLSRDELPEGWSPIEDSRLTVWEATQHLIARLQQSESLAAELLPLLGDHGEQARALAYLLFQKATDIGLADEAAAYNGLITAWPALQAASSTTDDQRSLL